MTNTATTAAIINVFGANILGAVIVVGWTALLTLPFYAIIKKWLLRVNKVHEIIGLDTTQVILGSDSLESWI
jgi:ammonia channel protein AmtB